MRQPMLKDVRLARIVKGPLGSSFMDGYNGAFFFDGPFNLPLRCIVSDGLGWEHVSVSTHKRCPNWPEMNYIKRLFWDDEETVIQYHPPKSKYVNHHPFTLHLWRPIGVEVPLPAEMLVDPKASDLVSIAGGLR